MSAVGVWIELGLITRPPSRDQVGNVRHELLRALRSADARSAPGIAAEGPPPGLQSSRGGGRPSQSGTGCRLYQGTSRLAASGYPPLGGSPQPQNYTTFIGIGGGKGAIETRNSGAIIARAKASIETHTKRPCGEPQATDRALKWDDNEVCATFSDGRARHGQTS